MSNYMKKYSFRAWPLYEWGGGVFKRFSHFSNSVFMSPQQKGGGHIVFGADPVGVGVRVASFPCVIF